MPGAAIKKQQTTNMHESMNGVYKETDTKKQIYTYLKSTLGVHTHNDWMPDMRASPV